MLDSAQGPCPMTVFVVLPPRDTVTVERWGYLGRAWYSGLGVGDRRVRLRCAAWRAGETFLVTADGVGAIPRANEGVRHIFRI